MPAPTLISLIHLSSIAVLLAGIAGYAVLGRKARKAVAEFEAREAKRNAEDRSW
ncbi:hypothetical protein [Bradyrhizobium manausense]|uniref:hypothetical protein n=1 Tax=Bradyrhizobium manausense TaxID=989370 RepID=UPI000A44AC23|nr:hypothetical protein [Bradyrhizobium manausense]